MTKVETTFGKGYSDEIRSRAEAIESRLPIIMEAWKKQRNLSPCGTATAILLFGPTDVPDTLTSEMATVFLTYESLAQKQGKQVEYPGNYDALDKFIRNKLTYVHGLAIFLANPLGKDHVVGAIPLTNQYSRLTHQFMLSDIREPKGQMSQPHSWDYINHHYIPFSFGILGRNQPGVAVLLGESR